MMIDEIKKEIGELQKRILDNTEDVAYLKKKLERLQITEFEEDLRESGNSQLLQE